MSFAERNVYQGFLIKMLKLKNPDDIFRFGSVFAKVESEVKRCPTPWEVIKEF